jgi:nitroreductase
MGLHDRDYMRHPHWKPGEGELREAPVRDLPRYAASRRTARRMALRRGAFAVVVVPLLLAAPAVAAFGAVWVAWRFGVI